MNLTIQRQPVISGNLKSIGYDAATKTLDVEFASGAVYRYSDVPKAVHADLMDAESVGGYFTRNVRNKFTGTPLESLDVNEGSTTD